MGFLFCLQAVAAVPEMESADLIFQTSASNQSYAIMWASKSLFSHVGMIERDGGKTYVIEAIGKVSRTPLSKWIKRGRLGRFAFYRVSGLTAENRLALVAAAKTYLGRGYDLYFHSGNREIYCSELIELAFKDTGLTLGKPQKVRDLDVDNSIVRRLVRQRWRKHPICQKPVNTFEQCWAKILEDELITPLALTEDPRVKLIFSNYPGD